MTASPYLAAGPYSQAIKAAGQVFVAGQIPADPHGKLVEGSIAEKTKQCCENLKAILEEAGSGIGKVVRAGVGLVLCLPGYLESIDLAGFHWKLPH